MNWGTALAIYFLIWWIALFVSLPFAMRSQAEDGIVEEGTEPGAPTDPQLAKRLLWNTVLSSAIFFVFWFVFYYLDISIEDLPRIVPERAT